MSSLVINGATLIDGNGGPLVSDAAILVQDGRIKAVGPGGSLAEPPGCQVIDAAGKFVIPGLMNANVHLLMDIRIENLARYLGQYEDLIAEAAQLALKYGQTTVFDTYGPRRFLMAVRDRINRKEIPGSRIFCAGNIVGLDGPYSNDFDFFAKSLGTVSSAMARRINAYWVENVGRHLMWLTPEMVAEEVRSYIGLGVDFVKYASNDHVPGAFLAFSERTQTGIVGETHRAGLTAQAHTTSVEGLRVALEAGCDLIQHANSTGPTPIPQSTQDLFAARGASAVIFPYTLKRIEAWTKQESYISGHKGPTEWQTTHVNAVNLVASGAKILLGNDGSLFAPEAFSNPKVSAVLSEELEEGNLFSLDTGHFYWFRAMEEKGAKPMQMLQAATRNIAEAYGKADDLGTLEVGKIADLIILDGNPLEDVDNYRKIHLIVKDGDIVDRDALPQKRLLTARPDAESDEEQRYVTFLSGGAFPPCPCCIGRRGFECF